MLARPTPYASHPVPVRPPADSLHASFSLHLAMTTLRFAWIPAIRSPEDFHLQARGHAGHTRIGVQRPATALTGPDPVTEVCRQTATKVNSTELLLVRCNALLGGAGVTGHFKAFFRSPGMLV